jgi:hypothetical protein
MGNSRPSNQKNLHRVDIGKINGKYTFVEDQFANVVTMLGHNE